MITSVERKTNLPLHLVFAAFINLNLRKEIVPNIAEIKILKHDNIIKYGTIWEEYTQDIFIKSKTKYITVIFEKNELFAVDYDEPGIRYRIEYHFSQQNDQTLVKIVHEGIPISRKGRMIYFLKSKFVFFLRRKLNIELNTLINHLENNEKNRS